jgi:hypothetical protein
VRCDKHEEESDHEAAHGCLAALAHAIYDGDASQQPHDTDENKESLEKREEDARAVNAVVIGDAPQCYGAAGNRSRRCGRCCL